MMRSSVFAWRIRFGLCGLVLALAGQLGGCASGGPLPIANEGSPPIPITRQLIEAEQQARARHVQPDLAALMLPLPGPYLLGPGDVLSIVVWDHPELATPAVALSPAGMGGPAGGAAGAAGTAPAGFELLHDGSLSFPYAGILTLGGLTEEQARGLLTARLARYFHAPNVTLRVLAYRSKRVYVGGEVGAPGAQAINDIPMTLLEALNRAGGMLPGADQSHLVLERDGRRYQVGLRHLAEQGIEAGRLLLLPGDVLRVPSRDDSRVFVSGEVTTPQSLAMHDGRLSLNEALGQAGGVNPLTGDGRQVYVVRQAGGSPVVYQLDAREPAALALAEQFELQPKDVVYVAASGLANWHRGISLLLPGELAAAVNATKP